MRDCGMLSLKWDIYMMHPSPRIRDHDRRGSGKSTSPEIVGDSKETVFQTQ